MALCGMQRIVYGLAGTSYSRSVCNEHNGQRNCQIPATTQPGHNRIEWQIIEVSLASQPREREKAWKNCSQMANTSQGSWASVDGSNWESKSGRVGTHRRTTRADAAVASFPIQKRKIF